MVHPMPRERPVCTELSNGKAWKIAFEWARSSPTTIVSISLTCHEYTQTIHYETKCTMHHIRRNDLIRKWARNSEENNFATSPENVTASYNNNYTKHPGPLIYMTDEKDPKYISELEAQLAAVNPDVTRADLLFAADCHNGNFCIYCNNLQLKNRASVKQKFGLHKRGG